MLRVILFLIVISAQESFACAILEKLASSYFSQSAKLDYHRDDGGPEGRFKCEGAYLFISKTPNSLRVERFKTGECYESSGYESGGSLNFYTATIYFEGNEIAFYDRKGVRHLAPVKCSGDEIYFDIPERETTWIDPWMPGRSQFKLSIQNSKLLFDLKRIYRSGLYFKATAEF